MPARKPASTITANPVDPDLADPNQDKLPLPDGMTILDGSDVDPQLDDDREKDSDGNVYHHPHLTLDDCQNRYWVAVRFTDYTSTGKPGPNTEIDWQEFQNIQHIHDYVADLTTWVAEGVPKRLAKDGVWDLVTVDCDPRKHHQPKVMKVYVLYGLTPGRPVQDWMAHVEQRFVRDTLQWSPAQFDSMIPKATEKKAVASARQQARKGNGPAKAAGPAGRPSGLAASAPAKKVAAATAKRKTATPTPAAPAKAAAPSNAVAKAKAQRAVKAGITPAAVTPPPTKANSDAVAKARAARANRAKGK